MLERLLGLYPNLKAKKLTTEMYDIVEKNGIVHCTTEENAENIIKSGIIRCSESKKCYSTKGKPCTFFFTYNEDFNLDNIDLNVGKKKNTYIHISNITKEQLEGLRYRSFDNAIMLLKEFVIDENSTVNIGKIEEYKKKRFQIKDIVFVVQYFSIVVPLLCILGLAYLVLSVI